MSESGPCAFCPTSLTLNRPQNQAGNGFSEQEGNNSGTSSTILKIEGKKITTLYFKMNSALIFRFSRNGSNGYNMDQKYGVPRAPEKVDRWERNKTPASLSELDENTAKELNTAKDLAASRLFMAAEKSKTYLWVMDTNGKIWIAVEEIAVRQPQAAYSGYPRRRGYLHPSEHKKLGHPTLIDGKEARIAGELALDEDSAHTLKWILNANSGRYCKQLPPEESHLDNVADIFRSYGLDVQVDYD